MLVEEFHFVDRSVLPSGPDLYSSPDFKKVQFIYDEVTDTWASNIVKIENHIPRGSGCHNCDHVSSCPSGMQGPCRCPDWAYSTELAEEDYVF